MASVGRMLLSPLATFAGLLKKPKAPVARPTATTDQAAMKAERQDVLARRNGAFSNMLTGAMGAESSAGGKRALGS